MEVEVVEVLQELDEVGAQALEQLGVALHRHVLGEVGAVRLQRLGGRDAQDLSARKDEIIRDLRV